RGQFQRAGKILRPISRTNVNGQAKQKKLPATNSARTVNPRQWVQGRTPAAFIGATCVPNNPSRMIRIAMRNIANWRVRRNQSEDNTRRSPVLASKSSAGRAREGKDRWIPVRTVGLLMGVP